MSDDETIRPRRRNGSSHPHLTPIFASVAAAFVLSVASASVSVRVMSVEVERAQSDLREVTDQVRDTGIRFAELQASKRSDDRRRDERWDQLHGELREIKQQQREILISLPAAWRATRRERD